MTKKTNQQHLDTKKKQKEEGQRPKLISKKMIVNLILTIVFIAVAKIFFKKCSVKIKDNKRIEIERKN